MKKIWTFIVVVTDNKDHPFSLYYKTPMSLSPDEEIFSHAFVKYEDALNHCAMFSVAHAVPIIIYQRREPS